MSLLDNAWVRPLDEDHDHDHECHPQHPTHEQAEVFIKGQFTSVDIELEWLIHRFNQMGMTTRFSCQGFDTMDEAIAHGFGDDRGYIMFDGESVFEMLQRGFALYSRAEADWNDEESDLIDRLGYAAITRDGHLISPAGFKSRWAVEFVLEEQTRRPGMRTGYGVIVKNQIAYNTVIRFPKEDLNLFRQIIGKLTDSVDYP